MNPEKIFEAPGMVEESNETRDPSEIQSEETLKLDLYPTELPLAANRNLMSFHHGSFRINEDSVATEYALTIYVNNEEMATIVCSPEHMDELVIGFLASEGVIRSVNQLKSLSINTSMGVARVAMNTSVNFNQKFYNKRYITSCCGKSRQSFYFFNDAQTAHYVEDNMAVTPSQVLTLIDEMNQSSQLFHETGGVHMASLCDATGVLISRTDIGRHNALDKIYGYVLHERVERKGKLIAFSGRLSSEVLLKVAKIGVAVVLARSAPTDLALKIAEELNITTVGFVRNASFNVYTHGWRFGSGCC